MSDHGLFGRDSMMWRVNREMTTLFGGARALLMQAAHPLVAAGARQTGAYRRDPAVITAETFSDLRARGVPLPVGTCVLTGSLSLPTPVRQGQTVTAKFTGLPALTMTLT